jgi:plastocyanin
MAWSGHRLCHNAVDIARKATQGNEVKGMTTRRMWALAAAPLVVVVLAAGCGGSSSSGGSSGSSLPKGSGQVISIPVASSGFAFTTTTATAKAGVVTLQSKNPQSVSHDISIKGTGVSEQGNEVSDGGTSTVTATVTPGKYIFYCSVDGHEQLGMKGVLTVS